MKKIIVVAVFTALLILTACQPSLPDAPEDGDVESSVNVNVSSEARPGTSLTVSWRVPSRYAHHNRTINLVDDAGNTFTVDDQGLLNESDKDGATGVVTTMIPDDVLGDEPRKTFVVSVKPDRTRASEEPPVWTSESFGVRSELGEASFFIPTLITGEDAAVRWVVPEPFRDVRRMVKLVSVETGDEHVVVSDGAPLTEGGNASSLGSATVAVPNVSEGEYRFVLGSDAYDWVQWSTNVTVYDEFDPEGSGQLVINWTTNNQTQSMDVHLDEGDFVTVDETRIRLSAVGKNAVVVTAAGEPVIIQDGATEAIRVDDQTFNVSVDTLFYQS